MTDHQRLDFEDIENTVFDEKYHRPDAEVRLKNSCPLSLALHRDCSVNTSRTAQLLLLVVVVVVVLLLLLLLLWVLPRAQLLSGSSRPLK